MAPSISSRSRQGCVDWLVPVRCGAVRRGDGQAVEDGGGIWPARGMEIWVLVNAGRVARVGIVVVRTLKICVVTLGAGKRPRG